MRNTSFFRTVAAAVAAVNVTGLATIPFDRTSIEPTAHASTVERAERLPRQFPISGERLVTVVLVEPVDGDRRTLDEDAVARIVDETDRLWSAESAGKIRVRLERVIGWRSPGPERCGIEVTRTLAQTTGWRGGPNRHFVAIDPDPNCGTGEGTVPGSFVWLSWKPLVGTTNTAFVLAHELGHNFGLTHTSAAGCSTALQPRCAYRDELGDGHGEYGGDDLLGGAERGERSLNPIARWQIGLLDDTGILTVDSSAPGTWTVELAPVSSDTGTRAVRVLSSDRTTSWWVSVGTLDRCDARSPGSCNGRTPAIVRVHTTVSTGTRFRILQQRTIDGAYALRVGATYPFPGGELTVDRVDGDATLTVTVH